MQEKTRLQREHLAMFGEDEDTKSPRGQDIARTRMGTQRRALIEARERADRLERERRDMEANDRNVDKIWEENETRAMSEQDTDILISEAELDALIV
jgi:tRNA 2-selenouridine synthase SelU